MQVLKVIRIAAASAACFAVWRWLTSEVPEPEDIQQAVRNSISEVLVANGDNADWMYDKITDCWWLPVPNKFANVSVIISVRGDVTVMEAHHMRFGIQRVDEHNRVVLSDTDLALGEMWKLCETRFQDMSDDERNPE